MPTAAENAEMIRKLEERVRELEQFNSTLKGAWRVAIAAWGALGISVVAVGLFIANYVTMHSSVAQHEKEIVKLSDGLQKLVLKNDELRTVHDRLRTYVTVLMDRDPKGAPKIAEAIVYSGQILDISSTQIAILDRDLGEPKRVFSLDDKVVYRINGKAAKFSDLEIAMNAELLFMGGKVRQIDAKP